MFAQHAAHGRLNRSGFLASLGALPKAVRSTFLQKLVVPIPLLLVP